MFSTARPLPPDPLFEEMHAPLWIAPHVDAASLVKLEHISFGLNRADSQSCVDERFWQH
jgi:hypothetical protein